MKRKKSFIGQLVSTFYKDKMVYFAIGMTATFLLGFLSHFLAIAGLIFIAFGIEAYQYYNTIDGYVEMDDVLATLAGGIPACLLWSFL